jgi:hypothetical protein
MSGNGDGFHTTRDCIVCGARLDKACWCSRCGHASAVRLCQHREPLLAWRVVERTHKRAPARVIAVTVGEVSVFTDGSSVPTREREKDLRRKLGDGRIAKMELGMDSFGAMALIGICQQCDAAFFLPDVQTGRKPPRIARVPLRERINVLLSSSI